MLLFPTGIDPMVCAHNVDIMEYLLLVETSFVNITRSFDAMDLASVVAMDT